jgi:hypothetical protein
MLCAEALLLSIKSSRAVAFSNGPQALACKANCSWVVTLALLLSAVFCAELYKIEHFFCLEPPILAIWRVNAQAAQRRRPVRGGYSLRLANTFPRLGIKSYATFTLLINQ